MFKKFLVIGTLLFSVAPAMAQMGVEIGFSNENIGISLSMYPELVRVPGYPVYYAPRLNSNYFFYDGMYWVYQRDSWYVSSWYNGPWQQVYPEDVPVYVLQVPVRYYRRPPDYFHGWEVNAAPRWGDHWGNEWAQRRSGWDQRKRKSTPAPAPLPVYQRKYSGDRYPGAEQQQALHSSHYRYRPHDPVVLQHYQAQREQSAPASPQRGAQGVPHPQPSQKREEHMENPVSIPAPMPPPQQRRGPPVQQQTQQPQHDAAPHQQQEPRSRSEETRSQRKVTQGTPPESEREQGAGQERDREKDDDHDRGQNRRK